MLVQVDAGYYCAGLIVNDTQRVVDAAPVLRWTLGKNWTWLKAYFEKKRIVWRVVNRKDNGL